MVELARALGRIPSVARVDLLTRLVADPKVGGHQSRCNLKLHMPRSLFTPL